MLKYWDVGKMAQMGFGIFAFHSDRLRWSGIRFTSSVSKHLWVHLKKSDPRLFLSLKIISCSHIFGYSVMFWQDKPWKENSHLEPTFNFEHRLQRTLLVTSVFNVYLAPVQPSQIDFFLNGLKNPQSNNFWSVILWFCWTNKMTRMLTHIVTHSILNRTR